MTEKILVTGGAGFIGSHVVDELIKLNKEVIALDDLSGGFKENVNPKAEFIQGSINDLELIQKIFKENKITYVFHFAAYAAEGLSHFIRKFNYENNLIGSIHLINESINNKVKCFLFSSSIAVYGKNQLPMTEDVKPEPEDPYGISKLAIEHDLKAAKKMFDLDYIIFRFHNVYGEKQNIGDKYRNVIGIFMNKIMQNESLTVFGDGEQTRAFSYIGDIAPIITKSIFEPKAYNEIFNIGADEPCTVNVLLKEVVKAMKNNEEHEIKYEPQRNEVVHAYSAHEKAKSILGYETKHTLQQGLKKMADWAKIAGIRESQEFKNLEVEENLPPSWKKNPSN